MVKLTVKADVKKLTRSLSRMQHKQIPFATSKALNDTAFDARKDLMIKTVSHIDRPTPFTKKGFLVKKSTKRNLTAQVFIKDSVYKYLKWIIEGGTRTSPGKGTGVPTRNTNLNQYGNIRGRRQGLAKGKNQFIATIKGISGVWKRTGGKRSKGVKLMVVFEKSVSYRKTFPFVKLVDKTVKRRFTKNFERSMRKALATAR